MSLRYLGHELPSSVTAYPVLEIVSDWMDEKNGPLPDHRVLLHRLRQAGFCFCETMFGCSACKGRQNVGRNQFENNYNPEDKEPKEVPLKLGIGGPVIGTATVDKDGNVAIGEITDENLKKKLQGDLGSLSLLLPHSGFLNHPHG